MIRVDFQPISSRLENVKLENFPRGPSNFEVITKFCYGQPIDLSPNNVALLRCGSEFLEMTEEFEDGNLISKTEAFLTFIVLASWRDLIILLKTCENLSPWAENLQIERRCCDSISWKAFQNKNEIIDDEAFWFDDVTTLRIDHFGRIIAALKSKRYETRDYRFMHPALCRKMAANHGWGGRREKKPCYGKNELHLSIRSGTSQEGEVDQNKEHKTIIESLISILPPKKEVGSCKFLLCMLKMAMIYNAT